MRHRFCDFILDPDSPRITQTESSVGDFKYTVVVAVFGRNDNFLMTGRRGQMMLRAMSGQSWIIAEEISLRPLFSILSRLLSRSFCRESVDRYIPCSL